MTLADIRPGARLVLHSQQVKGHYIDEGGGMRTHYAVPGNYTVQEVFNFFGIESVKLKSDHPLSDPFICQSYHLGAILGPWSVPTPCQ